MKSIFVYGDIIIDVRHDLASSSLCRELPQLKFNTGTTKETIGGAGYVAQLCSALNYSNTPVHLLTDLRSEQIDLGDGVYTHSLTREHKHLNLTRKHRFFHQNQRVFRVDDDIVAHAIHPHDQGYKLPSSNDVAIISDYAKGAVRERINQEIIQNALVTLVDPKDHNWERFEGCYLIKPNLKEVPFTIEEIQAKLKECDIRYCLFTDGSNGMTLIDQRQVIQHFPSESKTVIDVCGAGDVVMAAIAHATLQGRSIVEAISFASKAAAYSVGFNGCYLFSEGMVNNTPILGDIQRIRHNKKVVLTNGCFDLLHASHVHSLKQAKAMGDFLVVGLDTDDSVKQLKGDKRPIMPYEQRKQMLEALDCVDLVIPFHTDELDITIAIVRPDVLVKGHDHEGTEITGSARIDDVRFTSKAEPNFTTTDIIQRIQTL